jgi:hypothetical protein
MEQDLFSHVVGSSERPLLDWTVGQALDHAAECWPDETAIRASISVGRH